MRRAVVAVLIALEVIALASSYSRSAVEAKGAAVGIEPASGEAGTPLELFSEDWLPGTEVRIFSAFAISMDSGYDGAVDFTGPLATIRSDSDGDWSISLQADIDGSERQAQTPGFLFFRAESDNLPTYLENAITSYFVLTVDGRRPQGAGEINISLTNGQGASAMYGFFGWREAGEPFFFSPYSIVPVPFDTTIAGLADGDWEITAIGADAVEPAGENVFDISTTLLCLNPSCAAGTPAFEVHRAVRVTIRDGSVVAANVKFAPLAYEDSNGADEGAAAQSSASPGGDVSSGKIGLIVGATVVLTLLTTTSYLAGRKRTQ